MQTFNTPAPITAVLDIPAGRVQLIAADRADTVVEIAPANPGKGRDAKAAERMLVGYADGVLRIEAPEPANRLLGHSGSVEITVRLPSGSRVQGKAGAAEFRAVGRLGEVAFDGAHGPVKVDEAAVLHLTAHVSDVTVGRLTGSAEITVQMGDVHVAEAHAGTVVLSTQSGSLSVEAAQGVSATLDAGTGYGRVHNALRNTDGADSALAIRATTHHGDITARSL